MDNLPPIVKKILAISILISVGCMMGIISSNTEAQPPKGRNVPPLAQKYYTAQKNFISDMHLHDHESTDKNKCATINPDTWKPFSLAAIVFAFDYNESKNGTEGQSIRTNNWSSLHPKGSYYYKWDGKSQSVSSEPLRIYKTPEDGMADTMYLLKYAYGCNLDWDHVAYYIYGKGPYNVYVPHLKMTRAEHVTIYRDRLFAKMRAFEKL